MSEKYANRGAARLEISLSRPLGVMIKNVHPHIPARAGFTIFETREELLEFIDELKKADREFYKKEDERARELKPPEEPTLEEVLPVTPPDEVDPGSSSITEDEYKGVLVIGEPGDAVPIEEFLKGMGVVEPEMQEASDLMGREESESLDELDDLPEPTDEELSIEERLKKLKEGIGDGTD